MKIIYTADAINEFGKNVIIRISEPETGRNYGYSVKLPSEVGTTRGVFGTYTRSNDELTGKEIIDNIIKKARVTIID